MKITTLAAVGWFAFAATASAVEMPDVFPRGPLPQSLEVLTLDGLTAEDEHLAAILQAMVNRPGARWFL